MRNKRALVIVTTGIAAAALALSACSSSGGNNKNTGGNTAPPASNSSSGGGGGGGPEVGVILPDTTTSNRYTLYDQPLLQKAFDAAGIKAIIQNAHGSNDTFVSDAQAMISQGVKVLLIDPADPATGISVEQAANQAGVKVIDYDRVNLGGSAAYYVSFDNEKVGELQAQGLLDCLNAKGISPASANIIELNGGTDIDNNAVLFKAGAHKVWAAKGVKPKVEQDVAKWDNTVAATDFQQAFTQDPKVQGVLAANDGIAAAAISTLKQNGLKIPVTGQDATIQGIQYILTGDQCLTIFKDVSKEADAASKLAIALVNGDTATANSLATGTLHDPTGNRDIPSVLLVPTVITKDNVKDVVTAGALTVKEICKGIQQACAAAGLS